MEYWQLVLLFFIIAAVYSSAGFGGGSSYLAVMALFSVTMTVMRPTSLFCNIVVVIGGTYIFWKNGYLNFKKILPLSIASIPLAYLGATTPIKEHTFFILLGISLVIAALLMFFQKYFKSEGISNSEKVQNINSDSTLLDTPMSANSETQNSLFGIRYSEIFKGGFIGGAIGFLSGMVGIGGGIFLSPILNLMRWDTPKNIAATASFFILVNSISGLIGQLSKNPHIDWGFTLPLMAAVLIGGQLGSRFSALKLDQTLVRQVTAVVVLYSGINILWIHL